MIEYNQEYYDKREKETQGFQGNTFQQQQQQQQVQQQIQQPSLTQTAVVNPEDKIINFIDRNVNKVVDRFFPKPAQPSIPNVQREAQRSMPERFTYEMASNLLQMPPKYEFESWSRERRWAYIQKEKQMFVLRTGLSIPRATLLGIANLAKTAYDPARSMTDMIAGNPQTEVKPWDIPGLGSAGGATGHMEEGARLYGLDLKKEDSAWEKTKKLAGPIWYTSYMTAGDLASAFVVGSLMKAPFKPKIKVKETMGLERDVQPINVKNIKQSKVKPGDLEGTLAPDGTVSIKRVEVKPAKQPKAKPGDVADIGQKGYIRELKPNKNTYFLKMTKEEAKAFGGNPSNTYYRMTPDGIGGAYKSVVQTNPGWGTKSLNFLKERYGKKNVLPGPTGPMVVLETTALKGDPSFWSRQVKNVEEAQSLAATKAAAPATQTMAGEISNMLSPDPDPAQFFEDEAIAQYEQEIADLAEYEFYTSGESTAKWSDKTRAQYEYFKSLRIKDLSEIEDMEQFRSKRPSLKGDDRFDNMFHTDLEEGIDGNQKFDMFKEQLTKEREYKNKPKPTMTQPPVADGVVYRQMSPADVGFILNKKNPNNSAQTFFASSPGMAIGQGAGAGLNPIVEFDKNLLPTIEEYKGKPGLDFAGGELVGLNESVDVPDGLTGDNLFDAVKKVAFKNGSLREDSNIRLIGKLRTLGYKETKTSDGIIFEKPAQQPQTKVEKSLAAQGLIPENRLAALEAPTPDDLPKTLMQKPIRGFEKEMPTDEQIDQVLNLLSFKKINRELAESIARNLSGKSRLYDLTQEELFAFSESLNNIPEVENPYSKEMGAINSTWWKQVRRWSADLQSKTGRKVYDNFYRPMRDMFNAYEVPYKRETKVVLDKAKEILTKINEIEYTGFKSKMDFKEELRMVNEYVQGNKKAITENKTLSPKMKEGLIELADFIKLKYAVGKKKYGIESERFKGVYTPHSREASDAQLIFKSEELRPTWEESIEKERQGSLWALESDPIKNLLDYIRKGERKLAFGDTGAYDGIMAEINTWPERDRKAAEVVLKEKLGYKGIVEESMDKLNERLTKATNGIIPRNASRELVKALTGNPYYGALGYRVIPFFRDLATGAMQTVAHYGTENKATVRKYMKAHDAEIEKQMEDWNLFIDDTKPYGGQYEDEGSMGFLSDYEKFNQFGLKLMGKSERMIRKWFFTEGLVKFWGAYQKLQDGKIDYNKFFKEIDLNTFDSPVQDMIVGMMEKNTKKSIESAFKLFSQDKMDTAFHPYKKGEQGRLLYGFGGKMGGQFLQWPLEYAQMLKSWAKKREWDKFLRAYGLGIMIERTAEDMMDADTKSWKGVGPLTGMWLAPGASMAWNVANMYKGTVSQNDQLVNDSQDELIRTIKLYGGSATGIQAQNSKDFLYSIKRAEEGIKPADWTPEKPYGFYSENKKYKYSTDFAGLVKELFGFNSAEQAKQRKAIDIMAKEEMKLNEMKTKATTMFAEGDYDAFADYVTNNNLDMSSLETRLKSHILPLAYRWYDTASDETQIRFRWLFKPEEY